MIILENYSFFVDSRVSKNNKTYYGLFIKIGDSEQLVCFINKSTFDTISALSK